MLNTVWLSVFQKVNRAKLNKPTEKVFSLKSFFKRASHTINDPGHPPQPEQDEQAHAVKGIFVGDVHDIQDEGHDYNDPIEHLKLVVEKLEPKRVQLKTQLHHEEGEQRQAEVVKHLHNDNSSN